MAYVDVPKDLTKVKSKVFMNLTKRQLVCFGIGALVGIPIYFLSKDAVGSSTALTLMMITLVPAFLFGIYEKNGQPLEAVLRNFIRSSFLRPKVRPYRTENFYAALQRQEQLEQEVKQIAREKEAPSPTKAHAKADAGRAQADRSGHRKGEAR